MLTGCVCQTELTSEAAFSEPRADYKTDHILVRQPWTTLHISAMQSWIQGIAGRIWTAVNTARWSS